MDKSLIDREKAVFYAIFSKKMKKSEIFLQKPLDFPRENSIIGLTLGDEGRRPREAAGQLEGIGDVLSDGPRKFLGS